MTTDRQARLRELAWRSRAERARAVFAKRLPEGALQSIMFLGFDETNRHIDGFRAATASIPEDIVRDLAERWPDISSLWNREEMVIWLPAINQEIGGVALPFGLLSDHIAFFLAEDQGALCVADTDLRRGFFYLSGETENVLRLWPRP